MSNLAIVGPLHDPDGIIKTRLEQGALGVLAKMAERFPIVFSATTTERSRAIEELIKGSGIKFIYEPQSAETQPDANERIRLNYHQCLGHDVGNVRGRLFFLADRLVFAANKYPKELNKMIKQIEGRVNKPDFRNEVFLTVNRSSIRLEDFIYESVHPWATESVYDRPFPWRDWGGDGVTYPYSQIVPEAILAKAYSMALSHGELLDMGSGAWVLSKAAALGIVKSQKETNMRFPEGEWPFIVKLHGGTVGSAGRFGKVLEWEHDPDGSRRWNEGTLRIDPTLEWLMLFKTEKYKSLVDPTTREFLDKSIEYLKRSKEGGRVQSGASLESLG